MTISIHALREEGDLRMLLNSALISLFLSTPSARRATRGGRFWPAILLISIHALREEGDCRPWTGGSCRYDFYPRPPRGGRQRDVCKRYPDG